MPRSDPWQHRISTGLAYPDQASEALQLAEQLGNSLERHRLALEPFDCGPWLPKGCQPKPKPQAEEPADLISGRAALPPACLPGPGVAGGLDRALVSTRETPAGVQPRAQSPGRGGADGPGVPPRRTAAVPLPRAGGGRASSVSRASVWPRPSAAGMSGPVATAGGPAEGSWVLAGALTGSAGIVDSGRLCHRRLVAMQSLHTQFPWS